MAGSSRVGRAAAVPPARAERRAHWPAAVGARKTSTASGSPAPTLTSPRQQPSPRRTRRRRRGLRPRQWGRADNGEGVSQAIVTIDTDRAVGLLWVAMRPQPHVGGLAIGSSRPSAGTVRRLPLWTWLSPGRSMCWTSDDWRRGLSPRTWHLSAFSVALASRRRAVSGTSSPSTTTPRTRSSSRSLLRKASPEPHSHAADRMSSARRVGSKPIRSGYVRTPRHRPR